MDWAVYIKNIDSIKKMGSGLHRFNSQAMHCQMSVSRLIQDFLSRVNQELCLKRQEFDKCNDMVRNASIALKTCENKRSFKLVRDCGCQRHELDQASRNKTIIELNLREMEKTYRLLNERVHDFQEKARSFEQNTMEEINNASDFLRNLSEDLEKYLHLQMSNTAALLNVTKTPFPINSRNGSADNSAKPGTFNRNLSGTID